MYIDENSKPKEKLKAWYLFTDDFIAGTQHLTNQQIGIYIRSLCWNWNKRCCGIPNDKDIYFRIGNCITDQERVSCETIIKEFFVSEIVKDSSVFKFQHSEPSFILKHLKVFK